MGEFTKRVRDDEIAGPLRRAFNADRFRRAHEQSATPDDGDDTTLAAGIAIHQKLDAIRAALPLSLSKDVSATTKVRAFVATANHAFFDTDEKMRAAIKAFQTEQEAKSDEVYGLEEMAGIKLELAGGFSWLPDEIIESVVDGIQLPIRVVLKDAPSLAGSPKLNLIDWRKPMLEMNLGILYAYAEDLWDDCLWNEYRLIEGPGGKVFIPSDPDPIRAYRIGVARRTSLSTAFNLIATEFQRRALAQGEQLRVREVTGIERGSKRQVIKVAKAGVASDAMQQLGVQHGLATEIYYGELVDEPQAALAGASLVDLIHAWMVVARASQVLIEGVRHRNTASSENDRAHVRMPEYVPTLQVGALIDALGTAAGISPARASRLIEFLTYSGDSEQELWAQPLVPVGPGTVSPVFAAVVSPNLRRLVDIWMRQAGIDLSRRGPAFEAYVRDAAVEAIEGSALLKSAATCIRESYTFNPPAGRDEEIDLLFSIGNTVFVGEAKCVLEPTEAKGIAMHRRTVLGAADQVLRKAKALEDNRAAFIADVERFGMKLTEDFKVLPLIVVSTTTHVGIAASTVPVIDHHLLGRYLDGSLSDYAYHPGDPASSTQSKVVFYANAAEAEARAAEYFARPPQMQRFLRGLTARIVPIPAVNDSDWSGRILTFECVAGGRPLSMQDAGTQPI